MTSNTFYMRIFFKSFVLLTTLIFLYMSSLNAQSIDYDKNFDAFKDIFLQKYWKLLPLKATYNGYHKHDDLLPVLTPATLKLMNEELKKLEYLLQKNNLDQLSPNNKTDYYLIQGVINSSIWYNTHYKAHQWNPSKYNLAGVFDKIVNSEQTDQHKLNALLSKLAKLPAYYKAAQKNLQTPTIEHTQLAIQQLSGGLNVYEKKVAPLLKKHAWKSDKIRSKKKGEKIYQNGVKAVKEFISWLENSLLPQLQKNPEKARSFRLGPELYQEKFDLDIVSQYTVDEIFEKGLAEKDSIHQKMKKLTQKLWSKYFDTALDQAITLKDVRSLIEKISEKHVKREEFVDAIKAQIPELEAFVKEKDLLYLDPAKPLKVRETPAYMRGVAGASISAPGPYETHRPTYYNVSPLDNYTEAESESYLREYNHYILQILNIHEAVPGHYTQLVYANKSPSIIKSLFGNTTMIEGWACYVERMMLEEGYGDGDTKDEMWLMYYKWNLRELCNALIDMGVHTKNWSKEQVMDLLYKEAFQEKTEAEGKWRRVQLTQVQLCSYYTGLTEIYELRENIKKEKEYFDLKLFHSKFLNFGSAPVKYIKELMQ